MSFIPYSALPFPQFQRSVSVQTSITISASYQRIKFWVTSTDQITQIILVFVSSENFSQDDMNSTSINYTAVHTKLFNTY